MAEKIVIVEDDQDLLDILKFIFQDEGFRVSGFTEICSTELLISEAPNLVLLDLWLGEIPGEKILDSLKQDKRSHDVPVLMVSGAHKAGLIADAHGADAFIAKPFDCDELIHTVKTLLNERHPLQRT
ncbi:MAG: response regulator [Mucilaginibacter polytrichastri]|nr:response regulator [Mucilaginibacter polytrichastri]